jgi:hypothetical protein
VLGDDTAADSKTVGFYYSHLLRELGVVVNPIKGFSGDIVEFAKQIFIQKNQGFHSHTAIDVIDFDGDMGGYQNSQYKYCANLSPVGAKNVLLAIRYPIFLTSLIMDMANKDFRP